MNSSISIIVKSSSGIQPAFGHFHLLHEAARFNMPPLRADTLKSRRIIDFKMQAYSELRQILITYGWLFHVLDDEANLPAWATAISRRRWSFGGPAEDDDYSRKYHYEQPTSAMISYFYASGIVIKRVTMIRLADDDLTLGRRWRRGVLTEDLPPPISRSSLAIGICKRRPAIDDARRAAVSAPRHAYTPTATAKTKSIGFIEKSKVWAFHAGHDDSIRGLRYFYAMPMLQYFVTCLARQAATPTCALARTRTGTCHRSFTIVFIRIA